MLPDAEHYAVQIHRALPPNVDDWTAELIRGRLDGAPIEHRVSIAQYLREIYARTKAARVAKSLLPREAA